jgi:sulfatase maturation enzyme AslB (radical SAM superfamily)
MKTRIFEEHNYKSFWLDNGTTVRIKLDQEKPMTELKYPEFYDIKITGNCEGGCEYCYMDSKPEKHYVNIIGKFLKFFSKMDRNQLPYQIAIGGGEPTSHPDFHCLLFISNKIGIVPNYTTNGMFTHTKYCDSIIEATKHYCGGVAVSTHKHLEPYWKKAVELFYETGVRLNLHIIISDKESIDYFNDIYNDYSDKIDYFVLLPYGSQGRAKKKDIDWDYLLTKLPENKKKIAFGANFYNNLINGGHNINVSLYEPEIMSKFLDLKDMKVYKSSFNLEEEIIYEN